MDTVPIELEETPLNLEVVVDSKTKCVTMKTLTETSQTTNAIPIIFSKDPLQKEDAVEPDFEKMTELEKLIYSERQRLLQVKRPVKHVSHNYEENEGLTKIERDRIRMRKRRARETEEERATRKFRQRIITMKMRLLQRLKNFDDESYLEEIKKRNTEKIRQRRLEQKLKETPEETLERKNKSNNTSRLTKLRQKAFKTPEEIVNERQKKLASLKKCLAKKTSEERRAHQKIYRERAKERYRKLNQERKTFDLILQGKSIEEIEAMEDDVKFKSKTRSCTNPPL